jgi:hypothetical protein
MDDIAILSDDKQQLHEVKGAAAVFMRERLGLVLHPRKVQVMPLAAGVDFLGYRLFPHHRLLRKSTVVRFVARLKREKLRGGALRRIRFALGWFTRGTRIPTDFCARWPGVSLSLNY